MGLSRGRAPGQRAQKPGVHPELRCRVSTWVKDRLDALVKSGKFQTLGGAVDQLLRARLAGDYESIEGLPGSVEEIDSYFPVMASGMPAHVWGGLTELEKRLCVLVAFFPSVTDVEVSRWLPHVTPNRVRHFRVSDIGLLAVHVALERWVLANRLRFWSRQVKQAEDPEHPLSRESNKLLGNKWLAQAEKREVTKQKGRFSEKRPVMPQEMDGAFMDYAEQIWMTPMRFLHLTAKKEGRRVTELVAEIVAKLGMQQPQPEGAKVDSFL